MNKNEKEELLKEEIFDIYSEWRNDPSNDRFLIYYQRLCKQIYIWCKDYLFRKLDNMGEEIAIVTKRIMINKERIPTDKNGYFRYLHKSLYKEKASFYRKYGSGIFKFSKEIKSKIRISEDVLKMKERYLGRELTKDEEIKSISDWFGISTKKACNILHAMHISSMDSANNNREHNIDIIDSASKSFYMENMSINPLDEYLIKTDKKHIREAVVYLINKKQARSRDCYRALFTLHCIENYKDFEELYPVLDSQILETWRKEGKNPNQYEIYQKFKPKAKKSSAGSMATTNLHEFLNDIEAYLKSKNQ